MSVTTKKFYTTNDLLKAVKRRASIPENQSTFTEEDFLAFANEEMDIGILPHIMMLHEDYLMFTDEVTLVARQNRYAIPYRAIGNKLKDLEFKDVNGNIQEMTRIDKGARAFYQVNRVENSQKLYYVENNKIVLVPGVDDGPTGSLVFTYYIRPSALVSEDRVATVSSFDADTGVITVNSVPEVFTTSEEFDIYQFKSPHRPMKIDLTATAIDTVGNTITFATTDIPDDLEVGDHIALAEESIIPQIPSEQHVVLSHRIASRILESQGDIQGLQAANSKLQEMERKSDTLIDNRVENSPQKAVNRHSILMTTIRNKRYVKVRNK